MQAEMAKKVIVLCEKVSVRHGEGPRPLVKGRPPRRTSDVFRPDRRDCGEVDRNKRFNGVSVGKVELGVGRWRLEVVPSSFIGRSSCLDLLS